MSSAVGLRFLGFIALLMINCGWTHPFSGWITPSVTQREATARASSAEVQCSVVSLLKPAPMSSIKASCCWMGVNLAVRLWPGSLYRVEPSNMILRFTGGLGIALSMHLFYLLRLV